MKAWQRPDLQLGIKIAEFLFQMIWFSPGFLRTKNHWVDVLTFHSLLWKIYRGKNLWKLFIFGVCFALVVMVCKRKIMLKSHLQIKGSNIIDHKNILPIYRFSSRFRDDKRDVKPLLTIKGRLLARLLKLISMKSVMTLLNSYALLNAISKTV